MRGNTNLKIGTHNGGMSGDNEFNPYLDTMSQSLNDALSLKEKFEDVNVNQLAVTLFISRMNNGRNKSPSSN